MRSSESTPSRTDRPIPLYLVLAAEDHPRACTGRRLLRTGRVAIVRGRGIAGTGPILLDPHARTPLSRADGPRAAAGGILAVDCSWNRLRARGGYPDLEGAVPPGIPRRRLPFLLATNPQHFGRIGELNTAEALAAALHVLGRRKEAERLLDPFAGGPAFSQVNATALEAFAGAAGPEEILATEGRIYGPPADPGQRPGSRSGPSHHAGGG